MIRVICLIVGSVLGGGGRMSEFFFAFVDVGIYANIGVAVRFMIVIRNGRCLALLKNRDGVCHLSFWCWTRALAPFQLREHSRHQFVQMDSHKHSLIPKYVLSST
jgi:hypothetical protein